MDQMPFMLDEMMTLDDLQAAAIWDEMHSQRSQNRDLSQLGSNTPSTPPIPADFLEASEDI